jgi:putative heme iron utilization protein
MDVTPERHRALEVVALRGELAARATASFIARRSHWAQVSTGFAFANGTLGAPTATPLHFGDLRGR